LTSSLGWLINNSSVPFFSCLEENQRLVSIMKKLLTLIAALLLSSNALAETAEPTDEEIYQRCPDVYKNDVGAKGCKAMNGVLSEGEELGLLFSGEANIALARLLAGKGYTKKEIDKTIDNFAACELYKWCVSYEQRR
jgi:hypothetical protein